MAEPAVWYRVDRSKAEMDAVARVCSAILRTEREHLTWATIDAFSDHPVLPANVEETLRGLERIGEQQHEETLRSGDWFDRWRARKGPTFMGIELDPRRDDHFRLLMGFGPYSIHAEAYADRDAEALLTMHDSGDSVTFVWDPARIDELAERSDVPLNFIVPLDET